MAASPSRRLKARGYDFCISGGRAEGICDFSVMAGALDRGRARSLSTSISQDVWVGVTYDCSAPRAQTLSTALPARKEVGRILGLAVMLLAGIL